MAMVARAFILLVLYYCTVQCNGSFTGKAAFCRDPDTGKLHKINTTWPSTTFCGNYTCKVRMKNLNETVNAPLREINITNTIDAEDSIISESQVVTIEKKTENAIQPILHKFRMDNEKKSNKILHKDETVHLDTNDRYLSENEIKSISDLLHTVKKSDLDAIVEIYNLAQDIYKEMDRATTESVIDETINTLKNDNKDVVNIKSGYLSHKSYWYDPISSKNKPIDMDLQGLDVARTAPPTQQSYYTGVHPTSAITVPGYYYPLSNFQRSTSYVNPNPSSVEILKSCNKKNVEDTPNINIYPKPYIFEKPKSIQPSYLLPYPFAYIRNYNTSQLLNNFHNWPQRNYNDRKSRHFLNSGYDNVRNSGFLVNTNLLNEPYDLTPVQENKYKDIRSKKNKDTIPEWITEELPVRILNEVKANMDNTRLLKPYPLRKKVDLEKVGKLLKLDGLSRRRRDVPTDLNEEISDKTGYEVYLDKTICQSSTDVGYFRFGNLSEPYPGCCPQKIKS